LTIVREEAPNLLRLLLRLALGLALLLGFVVLLGRTFRPELEGIGRGFVARFGLFGMGLGTFIADGFHVPIPPQFYMLLGITSGVPATHTLAVIGASSFAGGWAGFLLSRYLLRFDAVARLFERPQKLTEAMLARYGAWALAFLSLLPVAYSVLCYLSGLSGFKNRAFLVIALFRLPRLVAYYYLVELGWSGL
jgi:membrane protein YqaA with SNARE-associated domain